jgi:hypothetical protein
MLSVGRREHLIPTGQAVVQGQDGGHQQVSWRRLAARKQQKATGERQQNSVSGYSSG